MLHRNLFTSCTTPLVLCYGSLIALISIARILTPCVALVDYSMTSGDLHASRVKHQQLQEKFPNRGVSLDLSITIATAKRAKPYIHAVLGSLSDAYGADLPPVVLCSVESTSYEVVEQLRREKWSVVDVNKGDQFNLSSISQRISKESRDYWKCLNITRNSEARYTLLLEDDVIVHPRFRSMIDSLIYQMDGRAGNVDYVKLYHINRLRHVSSTPQILAVALFLSLLLHCLLSPRPLHSLMGFLVLLAHLLFLGNLFPADLRFALTGSVYLTISESCCTPAVLFRTSSIATIVDSLSEEKSFKGHAKDHILDESRFIGRETDFNLVSHIGKISSLRRKQH